MRRSAAWAAPVPGDPPDEELSSGLRRRFRRGLGACIRLPKQLPADMGVAAVIVNHSTAMPTHMHQVLPRFSAMPVQPITDVPLIRPSRVYIIPASRDLHLDGEVFHLAPISTPRSWPDVITVFMQSLTQCRGGKLIAVIVAGCDGDGAVALCGIKAAGGITIAQKLSTVIQPDLPQRAIASGCIDFVLSAEDIAKETARIARAQLGASSPLPRARSFFCMRCRAG